MSAIKRPYLNLSTKELYDLFKSSLDDEIHLQTILAELSFRKTTSARKLEGDIKKALSTDVFAKPETILDPRNRSESHDRNVTSGHRLTDEQRVAVGYFKSQKSLKINAFAGAGKTSTLMAMSKASKRTGLYLAFNRSIANEAALKFPKYVNCRTTHSLAYKSVAGIFSKSNEKLIGTTNVNAINQYLKLGDLVIDNRKIPAITIAGMISRTLQKFKQSNDERIRNSHLPSVVGPVNQLADKSKKVLAQKIVEEAHQIWSKMIDPSSPIPLGHDGYLKLWALSNPILESDYILLDEAQDTNPVVLGVLEKQKSQIVYVGDRHQQIYEWRGAVNAMEKISTVHTATLTQSFRFGNSIADVAQRVLKKLGEKKTMRGNSSIVSLLGEYEADAIICRTNAKVIEEFLLQLQANKSVAIVGGTAELIILLNGVLSLKKKIPTDVSEFFGFASWDEIIGFSKTEEGESLRKIVGLVETNDVPFLISALKKSGNIINNSDIVLGTVHKVKGQEWKNVRLADDFFVDRKNKKGQVQPVATEELRILYVALTRSQEKLTLPENIRHFLYGEPLPSPPNPIPELIPEQIPTPIPKPPKMPVPAPKPVTQPPISREKVAQEDASTFKEAGIPEDEKPPLKNPAPYYSRSPIFGGLFAVLFLTVIFFVLHSICDTARDNKYQTNSIKSYQPGETLSIGNIDQIKNPIKNENPPNIDIYISPLQKINLDTNLCSYLFKIDTFTPKDVGIKILQIEFMPRPVGNIVSNPFKVLISSHDGGYGSALFKNSEFVSGYGPCTNALDITDSVVVKTPINSSIKTKFHLETPKQPAINLRIDPSSLDHGYKIAQMYQVDLSLSYIGIVEQKGENNIHLYLLTSSFEGLENFEIEFQSTYSKTKLDKDIELEHKIKGDKRASNHFKDFNSNSKELIFFFEEFPTYDAKETIIKNIYADYDGKRHNLTKNLTITETNSPILIDKRTNH